VNSSIDEVHDPESNFHNLNVILPQLAVLVALLKVRVSPVYPISSDLAGLSKVILAVGGMSEAWEAAVIAKSKSKKENLIICCSSIFMVPIDTKSSSVLHLEPVFCLTCLDLVVGF